MSRLCSTNGRRRRPSSKVSPRRNAQRRRRQPVRLNEEFRSFANRSTRVSGPISIIRVNNTEQYIDIENDGCTAQDQNLTGWLLRRDADKKTKIICKFPENFVLKSGCTARISCGERANPDPNERLILHQQDSKPWDAGSSIIICLIDADGGERAAMKQTLVP